MANEFDICAGGTVVTSLTFLNHHTKDCHITGLNLPNAKPPGPNYTVLAKSGSTPGTLTITFTGTPGTYPYSVDCCGAKETNPVIIVQ